MSEVDLHVQETSSASSRAADIPQELFENIIWYAGGLAEGIHYSTPQNHDMVKSLCTWALVSKYFVTICRPRLFLFLSLSNPKQLRRLLTLIEEFSGSTSFPPIATLVDYISIDPETEKVFWIHQVTTVLLPRIAPFRRENPLKLWMSLQTLETQHPRAIRHLISRSIQSLSLVDTHFPSVADLLQFLCGFKSAHTIRLQAISCATIPDSQTFPAIPQLAGYGLCHLQALSVYEPKDWAWTWVGTWLIGTASDLPRSQWDTSGIRALLCAIHQHHGLSLYENISLGSRVQFQFTGSDGTLHRIEFYQRRDSPAQVESVTIAIVFPTVGGRTERRIRRVLFKLHGIWTEAPTASAAAEQNREFWVHVVSAAAKLRNLQEIHFVAESMEILKPFMRTFYNTFQAECEGMRLVYGLVSDLSRSTKIEVPVSPEDLLPQRTSSAMIPGVHKGNLWIATNWDAFTSRVRVGSSFVCGETGRMDATTLA